MPLCFSRVLHRVAHFVLLCAAAQALAQSQVRPERMPGADVPTSAPHREPSADGPRWPGIQPDGQVLLPNQWSLNPAGRHVELGDFPVNIALHPKLPYAAILHAGYGTHEVVIVKLDDRRVVSRVTVPQAFYGVCFDHSGGRVFASGGEHDLIHVWRFADGLLSDHEQIQIVPEREHFVTTGLTLSTDDRTLFACGGWGHRVALVPLDSPGEPSFVQLAPDSYPYASLPDVSGKRLFVSLWGGSAVAVVDLASRSVVATWATPSHPTEMVLSHDGQTLFVSCANSNNVAVIDATLGRTREVITSALYPTAPNGSTPSSLALSGDGTLLAVANADNNNVAIFNVERVGKARSLGFVPTGWYPTSVRFGAGDELLVTSGKGLSPKANRQGPAPGLAARNVREYIGGLFRGTLSIIRKPTPAALTKLTAQAFACSPLRPDSAVVAKAREQDNPIPAKLGDPSPIKHCIYIVKENRTYDQVFGDIQEGNGDPSICLFGEHVTPNLHALVREFVLLDNFYVESEVSADGHEWSMGAYATDFVEKCWPVNYRGQQPKDRDIEYPAEGVFKIAVPAGGYIWDRCKAAGVSYRSYGEWVENGPTPDAPGRAKSEALEGHFDPLYRSYDLNYLDADRARRFAQELARFERESDMPQMIVLRLPNDHTSGTQVGKPTPTAMVAENDQGVGMVVEAVSRSKFWPSTAIFVVEDDAQNGSDHVDAHRTLALVISPYCRRRVVDSTLYSTSSMLRTMELILGLEPMSQFDAAATPMYASFTSKPDLTPYMLRPPQVDTNERNTAASWGADISATLELTREDASDDLLLNEIIWKSVRGAKSEMPPPVRAAFVFQGSTRPDSDDDDDRDDDHFAKSKLTGPDQK